MNHRFANRVSRLGLILFAAGGLTALGCSLIVEFDESKIPGEDVGVSETSTDALPDTQLPDTGMPDTDMPDTAMPTDTGTDTGTPDTGTPDTGTDTGTPDTGTDTGTPTDTGSDTGTPTDTATDDTATTDTATDDTAATDTATDDTATTDTGTDTGPADTGSTDTGVEDTADATVTLFFSTLLSGAQENPAVTTTATGTAECTLTISVTNTLVCTLTHTVVDANAAHIHGRAPFGVNTGVAFAFDAGTSPQTKSFGIMPSDVDDLKAGKFYVNVHSPTHVGGEIRGQLIPKGATLYAGRFVNAAGTDAGGATSGGGFGMFHTPSDMKMTYFGTVTGLSAAPTDAHVHNAGGVLFGLTLSGAAGTTTSYAGSSTVMAADVTAAEAGTLYANVHTAAVPGGEARADLTRIFTAP